MAADVHAPPESLTRLPPAPPLPAPVEEYDPHPPEGRELFRDWLTLLFWLFCAILLLSIMFADLIAGLFHRP